MGSIIKKIKHGRPYYYAVKSARVNGKPRIVWQKYLGTFDQLIGDKPSQKPIESVISEAGGVLALLNIAERIGLSNLINQQSTKKKQGPTLAHYILLAVLNRALDPCSKVQIGDWYESTILHRLWGFDKKSFTSQAFWNHMDLISIESIKTIQEQVSQKVLKEFKLDPSVFLYDTTNFYTYIDSGNKRCTLAQRGNNKAKKHHLKQVGLALVVTKDWQIPLFHRTYEGNRADRGLFVDVARELRECHKKIVPSDEKVTYVFDKGNISDDAMEDVIIGEHNFVVAIPSSQVSEIFETDIEKFKLLKTLPGTQVFCEPIQFCGTKCLCILTYSESFFSEQLNGISNDMVKCQRELKDYYNTLQKWRDGTYTGKAPNFTDAQRKVKGILSKEFMKDLFVVEIDKTKKIPQISYSINRKQYDFLLKHRLGRSALVSNHLKWTPENIIGTYRSLHHIEDAFKRMKNVDYLRWQPSFHWTDQKIQVHGLYCVLALLLASLARKLCCDAGIEMSLWTMLEQLSGIREVATIYPEGYSKDVFCMSRMSPKQRQLADLFEMGNHLPG